MEMTRQRASAPVEDLILHAAQEITESAYERFSEGKVSQAQLKEFYGVVSNWSRASEQVLETMQKLGIRT